MTDKFDMEEAQKERESGKEANDIRRLVAEGIYLNEANIAGVNVGGLDSAKPHSVSGMDKRVAQAIKAMDTAQLETAYGYQLLDDPETIISHVAEHYPDLFLLVTENAAKAAAWSLGDRTKIPFIMHEAATFRVSAEHSESTEVESNMTASGIRIFVPKDVGSADLSAEQIVEQAAQLAEYAVISSFMMHDVELQERLKRGDKAGAAAIALSSLMLSEKILHGAGARREGVQSAANALSLKASEAAEGFVIGKSIGQIDETIANRGLKDDVAKVYSNDVQGWGRSIVNERTSAIGNHCHIEVEGSKSERKLQRQPYYMSTGVDVHENPDDKDGNKSFSAKFKIVSQERTLDGLARELANIIELADKVKKKDEENGEGEGEGQGQGGQGLADAILSKFASEQGKGEGRADAQGQDGAGGPSNDQRIAQIGIFGSDAEGARFNELLARVDWHTATLQDSPVDWTDYLHGALLRATGIDRTYTWTRPSRRYASMGIYVPGFKRRRCKRIALCIDESGSIDMPKLEKFNEEIIRVIDTVNPEGVDVIHFSTQIAEESLIQGEIWEAKRLLNGGTSFKAAFQAVANRMAEGQEYDAIVFFTDMEDSGYWGLSRENVETILPSMPEMFWVAYGGCSRKPDFGTLINMDTGELGEFS